MTYKKATKVEILLNLKEFLKDFKIFICFFGNFMSKFVATKI